MKLRFNALAETPSKLALVSKTMSLKLIFATNATHFSQGNKKLLTQVAELKDSKNALATNKVLLIQFLTNASCICFFVENHKTIIYTYSNE